ncbi:MAG: nucleotidyl transferase AbiEii/AbiGii toxin family protein [Bacteroidales bacterium]|nr:nucleotidyl transferase AbiEii/AbiGii toxin family protein [Bacteroidales bacterium]
MLQFKTIEPGTLKLLKELQSLHFLQEARLVGETALALQLGHRKSIDLDYFGKIDVEPESLRKILSETHSITIVQESKDINIYLIDGIKVDFVNYRYSWIDAPVNDNGVVLAGIKDIAAMKINAVIGRGTKKDFIDLFFLLRRFTLQEMLDMYIQKYPEGSLFIAMKSLSYFEDAESDPMPVMLSPADWNTVKAKIRKAIAKL